MGGTLGHQPFLPWGAAQFVEMSSWRPCKLVLCDHCLAQPIHHGGPWPSVCPIVEPTSSQPGSCPKSTPFPQECRCLQNCPASKHLKISPRNAQVAGMHLKAFSSICWSYLLCTLLKLLVASSQAHTFVTQGWLLVFASLIFAPFLLERGGVTPTHTSTWGVVAGHCLPCFGGGLLVLLVFAPSPFLKGRGHTPGAAMPTALKIVAVLSAPPPMWGGWGVAVAKVLGTLVFGIKACPLVQTNTSQAHTHMNAWTYQYVYMYIS